MTDQLVLISQRIYCVLLHTYPAEHRRAYGPSMAQTFNALCRDAVRRRGSLGLVQLWLRTLIDVAVSAGLEHLLLLRRKTHISRLGMATLALVIVFSVLTGYVNLNANEVQSPMGCILLFSFLAGFIQPRAAWRWGLLIGLSIPLSYFIGFAIKYKVVDPPHNPITLVVLVIPALIPTYCGVIIRWAVSSTRYHAGQEDL